MALRSNYLVRTWPAAGMGMFRGPRGVCVTGAGAVEGNVAKDGAVEVGATVDGSAGGCSGVVLACEEAGDVVLDVDGAVASD